MPTSTPHAVSAGTAAILSLIPGAGHFYLGLPIRGATYLVIALMTCNVGGFGFVIWGIDAFVLAKRMNEGEDVKDKFPLWDVLFFWLLS